jgi:hypothetical protein
MATRSISGENVLQNNLGAQHSNQLTKPVAIILGVWFIAMASLLDIYRFGWLGY